MMYRTQFVAAAAALLAVSAFGQTVNGLDFHDCRMLNIELVTNDQQDKIVREACRSWHPVKWEDDSIHLITTPPTPNNDDRDSDGCRYTSPEGKYCAGLVKASMTLTDDAHYEYHFKKYQDRCPQYRVKSGPSGWYDVIDCVRSPDGKEFRARVIGWTLPQTFEFTLQVERREL